METGSDTVKILDNTVISASLKEISCLNLLERCSIRYQIVTSQEVYEESERGFKGAFLLISGDSMQIQNLSGNDLYVHLLNYLETRYPYLHTGELSSFLLALLAFELKHLKYYYVTDDNRAKKFIQGIHEDKYFIRQVGIDFGKINVTGTIGLIRRLKDHGIINSQEINQIISDLETSTFYVTPELIKYLRGIKS